MPTSDVKHGLALRFEVTIDSHDLGAWSSCQGLDVEFDVVTYQEAGGKNAWNFTHYHPGRTKYPHIKLTRAMTKEDSQKVHKWLSDIQVMKTAKSTGKITLFDAWAAEVFTWKLEGVMPAKWQGASLDASTTKVATETLELVHEGFLEAV
jgi:phage tail-like protein